MGFTPSPPKVCQNEKSPMKNNKLVNKHEEKYSPILVHNTNLSSALETTSVKHKPPDISKKRKKKKCRKRISNLNKTSIENQKVLEKCENEMKNTKIQLDCISVS